MNALRKLMLSRPGLKLAAAESVTCGRIQSGIGAISGASDFFLGGITAYTLDQKVRHLGVDRATAESVNCVSAEVAGQMACGACSLFGANLGVATTGYAEPAAKWNVAEPFVWWALAHRRGNGRFAVRCGRIDYPGEPRAQVQKLAAAAALSALAGFVAALREPAR